MPSTIFKRYEPNWQELNMSKVQLYGHQLSGFSPCSSGAEGWCTCCMPVYRWKFCKAWWDISPSVQRKSTRRFLRLMWLHGTGCSSKMMDIIFVEPEETDQTVQMRCLPKKNKKDKTFKKRNKNSLKSSLLVCGKVDRNYHKIWGISHNIF